MNYLLSSNDSSTSQPTHSADITTNKYQSGDFAHCDTDRLKTTSSADTEPINAQEQKHYDEYVLNVNNESGKIKQKQKVYDKVFSLIKTMY